MKLDRRSYEMDGAQCEYPAGKGPKVSCKHIAALCYGLEKFSRQLPAYLTSTDKLQHGISPGLEICSQYLHTHKYEIMPPKIRSSQQTQIVSQLDPHLNLDSVIE